MAHRLIFTNNTKLNNTYYISGSGVGAISASSRAAMKRRSNVNATTNERCCAIKPVLPPPPPPPLMVRYIYIHFPEPVNDTNFIQISQILVNLADGTNIAPGKTVTQGPRGPLFAGNPIDGIPPFLRTPNNIYHSQVLPVNGDFWQLDLLAAYPINNIVYYNRNDGAFFRAEGMLIRLSDENNVALTTFTCNTDLVQTFFI
jgi:hypothetical protein